MAEPFLAEVRLFAFNQVPRGWAPCNGQILPIQGNQALFSLIGATFGGDGKTNFALPDLRGRVAIHPGSGVVNGVPGGEEAHTLNTNELPAHSHQLQCNTSAPPPPLAPSPAGNSWAQVTNLYTKTAPNTPMNVAALATAGSSQAHPNMQPYLVASYCIALTGLFPPRP